MYTSFNTVYIIYIYIYVSSELGTTFVVLKKSPLFFDPLINITTLLFQSENVSLINGRMILFNLNMASGLKIQFFQIFFYWTLSSSFLTMYVKVVHVHVHVHVSVLVRVRVISVSCSCSYSFPCCNFTMLISTNIFGNG